MGQKNVKASEPNRLALDTNIFIYAFSQHPLHGPRSLSLLKSIEEGVNRGVTTTVTLAEIAIQPFRLSKRKLAQKYKARLSHFPNLALVGINPTCALEAAHIRAQYPVRLPDAIQLAGGVLYKARLFVTNDERLVKLGAVGDMKIVSLKELAQQQVKP